MPFIFFRLHVCFRAISLKDMITDNYKLILSKTEVKMETFHVKDMPQKIHPKGKSGPESS